jgi:prolyl-tRNA editing enzyme YbaK/EbsC (Cys-tRNA(Pro) deacylase)
VAAGTLDARLAPVPDPVDPRVPADPATLDPAVRRVFDAAARRGVRLEIHRLADTTHTAADAARALGVEQAQIVKSLVFVAPRGDGPPELIICLAAGTNRVDFALLAAVTGETAVRRATAREARELTGFSIGGIPPLGHPRPVRVVMDPDLGRFPEVWAAAGHDGSVFPVSPAALRALTSAIVAEIAEIQPTEAPAGTRTVHVDVEGTPTGGLATPGT